MFKLIEIIWFQNFNEIFQAVSFPRKMAIFGSCVSKQNKGKKKPKSETAIILVLLNHIASQSEAQTYYNDHFIVKFNTRKLN